MSFVGLARKWRPLTFATVVGQEHVTTTLRNAIRMGRIYHAYLFCGPRGVGKTTTARIVARALNCQQLRPDGEPCNECPPCQEILQGRSLDVLEIDGASNNSVEDVRRLRESAKFPPAAGRYKIYIVDEVHMLSLSAFNALLKLLEEPPPHLVFVLATTEPQRVPPTVLSRCQRFDFRRLSVELIAEHLRSIAQQEAIYLEPAAAYALARKAEGSLRDALALLDQAIAFCGTEVRLEQLTSLLRIVDTETLFRLTAALQQHDVKGVLELVHEVIRRGYDAHEFAEALLEHLRHLVTVRAIGSARLLDVPPEVARRYEEEAQWLALPDLLNWLTILQTTQQALRYSSQPRVRLEVGLVQMALLESAVEFGELLRLLNTLATQSQGIAALNSAEARPPYTVTSVPASASVGAGPQELEQSVRKFLEQTSNIAIRAAYQAKELAVQVEGETVVLTTSHSFLEELVRQQLPQLRDELKEFLGRPVSVRLNDSAMTPGTISDPQEETLAKVEQHLQLLLSARRVPSTKMPGANSKG
ncbi:MAG: DNA polymerase III subunit gamma/tau [Candidatus Kapabacteria bacterium]|nr:DNA polymerase III subunit gamma/tau [Candidatus Kapabacteria bacterium]MDW8012542.1 DNA polymerase III subunit gamma/tau [Bacteroidota bacterium]